MKGYTKPEKLKRWWPTMPVMHARAHSITLQVGPHLAGTYFFKVAKAADMCSILRIHNQCECCNSAEFADPTQTFFYKMAHDKASESGETLSCNVVLL